MKLILSIDTSCYTTSVSIMSTDGKLVADNRKVLHVEKGKRGLMQSEACFQHIKNLPELVRKSLENIDSNDIIAICSSNKPRPIEGSYMPVFVVGKSYAELIASILKKPLLTFSHQEGHIFSGIWSAKMPKCDKFIAFHLSGGTTEFLKAEPLDECISIKCIGGTEDLNAGQFIDRVGVALGLEFPAGKQLEAMATKSDAVNSSIPSYVDELNCSFSGAETMAQRMIEQRIDSKDIAKYTLLCISRTLEKVIINCINKTDIHNFLFVGGVSSNSILKSEILRRLKNNNIDCSLYFCKPEYSTDNSIGTALAGLYKINPGSF